jgi:hypothetical protein
MFDLACLGVSDFLGGSAWKAISRPPLAGYGYPARANSPKILDAPACLAPLRRRSVLRYNRPDVKF